MNKVIEHFVMNLPNLNIFIPAFGRLLDGRSSVLTWICSCSPEFLDPLLTAREGQVHDKFFFFKGCIKRVTIRKIEYVERSADNIPQKSS